MYCYLPTPYPDELLHSVISRYCKRIGSQNGHAIEKLIFGKNRKMHVPLPSCLNKVSQQTWLAWQMTGHDIVKQLTLLPYYTRYVSESRQRDGLHSLLGNNSRWLHMRLGLSTSNVKHDRYLRYCNACRKADISKYGETYWHRSHQLPGAFICPDHGEVLIDSKALTQTIKEGTFADANDIEDAETANSSKLTAFHHRNWLNVAKRSQTLLFGETTPWQAKGKFATAYQFAAIERGFVHGCVKLSRSKLKEAFRSFYGEGLLSSVGCKFSVHKSKSWLDLIFRASYSGGFHPLKHTLIQIFLENTPLDPQRKILFGYGPWKCPSPYGKHHEEFPIRNARLSLSKSNSGYIIASAKCSCGFYFSFRRTSEADNSLPIVNQVSDYGPAWELEAERLQQQGYIRSEIAKRMNIVHKTVTKLLSKKLPVRRVPYQKIAEWRQEWSQLIKKVADRSRSMAAEKKPHLWYSLLYHDRDWYLQQPKCVRPKRPKKSSIDWERRDQIWSRILRDSAHRIKKKVPVKRVTRNSMVIESGTLKVDMKTLIKLPLCQKAINDCSESVEDVLKRRLHAAAEELRIAGKKISDCSLKKKAHLSTRARKSSILCELIRTITTENKI